LVRQIASHTDFTATPKGELTPAKRQRRPGFRLAPDPDGMERCQGVTITSSCVFDLDFSEFAGQRFKKDSQEFEVLAGPFAYKAVGGELAIELERRPRASGENEEVLPVVDVRQGREGSQERAHCVWLRSKTKRLS
jgi:hypothetical protein